MAEKTTPADQDLENSPETMEESATSVNDAAAADSPEVKPNDAPQAPSEEVQTASEVNAQTSEETLISEAPQSNEVTESPTPPETSAVADTTADGPKEPDALQPYIDKAFETIQNEVEHEMLDKFLRSHVKTFREEWDTWPDSAKDAYLHMMTSQLLQRQAATIRIMNYEEFKLPVPSAQTKLFESIKQSQVKPKRCIPVLLLPPNLRPTYSLKK